MSEKKKFHPIIKEFDIKYLIDPKQFICQCGCGLDLHSPELEFRLNLLTQKLQSPIVITSGTRCPIHNKNVLGAEKSYHLYGKAADLYCLDYDPLTVGVVAWSVGFRGIVVYKTICHVDIRKKVYIRYNSHLFNE